MANPAATTVLLVVEPGVDGVFRHVEQLTHFLLDRPDIATHLAFSSVRGSPDLGKLAAAVAARGGRTLDLRVGNAPGPADARAFAHLRRLARSVRPDAIHAHSSKAGVLARALSWTGVRARYFYTPHAYFQMHGRPGPKRRFYGMIERALGRVGTTINCSASEAAFARRELGIPAARQRTILNGVDGERFRPPRSAAERREARVALGLPADGQLLGTVARLCPQKDPVTLYRALLPALAARPELRFAHLNAVGELAGEVEAVLAAAPTGVRARVHRLPAAGEPAHFYRALDAFVLPSLYEGLSLAVLEAAASGLPMILSDCPGNTDLRAHDFDRVRWTPPGDAAALTGELLAWAAEAVDAPPGMPLPCNHQQIAGASFSRERQFERLLHCYRGGGSEEQVKQT